MDQKIVEFISFIALNSIMVERSVEMVKGMLPIKENAVLFIKPDKKVLTIQLFTVLMSSIIVWLNSDVMMYPIYLNKYVAYLFAVLGASSGSSMWNDALSFISLKTIPKKIN